MLDNQTPFAVELLSVSDEHGQPMLLVVIKATYQLLDGGAGLRLAERQVPVCLTGESWGEPGQSSYKYEPEVSWVKPATDIVLIGHAWAPGGKTVVMDVEFSVGSLRRQARVFGDRVWLQGRSPRPSAPRPFETMPLTYEKAFGGWDKRHPDPTKHTFDERNPVGLGFGAPKVASVDGIPLPNLEDPRALLTEPRQQPTPVGFGFVSPHWQPRARLAGTYDDRWLEERAPLLPEDFDRRFFTAASGGLVAPGYLRGDEVIRGVGIHRAGRLAFSLPGQPPPSVLVSLKDEGDVVPVPELDTVIVNTDDDQVFMVWRAEVPLSDGPHDIGRVCITAEKLFGPTPP